MNFDDLEKTWEAQAVAGPVVKAEEVAARLERELRGVRRRFAGMVVMAAGLLLLSWSVAGVAHLVGIKRLTPLETTAHVAGSLFYLGWLALAVRSARAVRHEAERKAGTIRDSAAVSLHAVGIQIANYRIAAWTLPLAFAVTAVLAFAKFAVGELPGRGVLAVVGFSFLLFAIAGVAMWHRYRTQLKPRREELKQMLEEVSWV